MNHRMDRRTFLKSTVVAATLPAGLAAAGPVPLPVRRFGKTGLRLPILGYGGAALPKAFGNPLSLEERVKLVRYAYDRGIRYFDTAGNYLESQSILGEGLQGVRDHVCLVSKVETADPTLVRAAVAKSLRELRTDYLDAVLIHGTPGLQQMSVGQAFKIHAELLKLKNEKVVSFIGLSAHGYFDKALALIESGGFDLCMLSYGYLPRGHDQVFSDRMLALREACLAKAHELQMGVAAMKVIGAGMMGAWAPRVVPGTTETQVPELAGAAIRWALDDPRIDLPVIGMRLKSEIDENIRTLAGNLACTDRDRALLESFSARAMKSDAIRKMKVE